MPPLFTELARLKKNEQQHNEEILHDISEHKRNIDVVQLTQITRWDMENRYHYRPAPLKANKELE